MPRPLHIACLQTQPKATMAEAVDEAMPMAEAAVQAGAELIFLPEYCGGLVSEHGRLHPPSDSEDRHEFLSAFRDFAARRKVDVNVGSVAIDASDGMIWNRGYMLDSTGAIAGRYDKIHLFDVNLGEGAVYRESDTVKPGAQAVIHDIAGTTIGHTICYDLRFPQLFRTLAKSGAEILACPAAFTKTTGEVHWHALNRARAIENTRFVVSACAVGEIPGGGESYGHSLVIGPWGEILADGVAIPGVVHAQLDLDDIQTSAGRVPSLTHDRPYTLAQVSKKDVA